MIRRYLTFIVAALALAISAASIAPADAAAPTALSPLVGSWTVEQVPPGGAQHSAGTMVFTQSGSDLSGVLRVGGNQLSLSDIDDTGGIVSFTVVIPGNITLHYVGAFMGDELGLASEDEGKGSYTLTVRRAGAAATPQARAGVAPQAPRAGPAPQAAPPPAGDYITRLLAQTPAPAAPASPPVMTGPPPAPAPRVASASPPPAPRPAAPRPAPAPALGQSLEGNWNAQQTRSGSATPSAATLIFTRSGNGLAGIMRSGGEEMPLFDINLEGRNVSFTLVIPGTPYITVHYRGALDGNRLQLASPDEGQGVFKLDAVRVGAAALAAPTPSPLAAAPTPAPPKPAASPPASAQPPPRPQQQQTASVPAPPAPPPTPKTPATARTEYAPALQGNWTAQQTGTGSAAAVEAVLVFAGDKGTMRVGADEWPLFDVKQAGADVTFTLVIPGTPYITIHYFGTLADDAIQLASLDEGQGAFMLNARRAGTTAQAAAPARAPLAPAPAPPVTPQIARPQVALAPPPPPPAQQTPQIASAVRPAPAVAPAPAAPATPSPASARPLPPLASAPAAPPAKLPLPALRDLPPSDLAKTPLMGWSSRQKLGTRMTDKEIRGAADVLADSGLRAAGYVYVEVDDGWQGVRDGDGVLHPNGRFPDMKALADYVHSKGLKFGLSTSVAPQSCDGFEGSYGHEAEDAKAFAEWGIDHVVYDWCGAEAIYPTQSEMQGAYQRMGTALRSSGRDIVYGISAAGAFDVAQWGAKTGANVWRTGRDLDENWKSVADAGFGQNGKEGAAGPGRWNDPGLLQAGNIGMTVDENRMQLNLWAMLAAPLILGNDLRVLTRETVALLANRDVIAIDQDALGRQGKRVAQAGNGEVWARPLADGSVAVAFFNKGDQSAAVAVSWEQLGLEGPRQVRDLWWHENVGRANNNYVVFLQPHTSLLLKLLKMSRTAP
jgi:alpha-galactosidase